jgi:calcium-dependent protein kinase
VDHPNIINVQEIWEWDKMLFIVTDYCYGGDLFEYLLERDSFEENETNVIM